MKLKISVPLGHQPTSSVLMNEICYNRVLLQIIDINSKVLSYYPLDSGARKWQSLLVISYQAKLRLAYLKFGSTR